MCLYFSDLICLIAAKTTSSSENPINRIMMNIAAATRAWESVCCRRTYCKILILNYVLGSKLIINSTVNLGYFANSDILYMVPSGGQAVYRLTTTVFISISLFEAYLSSLE